MPARSIGTGTLSFGMVSIPIRLYSAGESASAVSFNLLHAKCKTRLKQQYVCPKDEEIVPRDQMVKGYEFSKDQYVTFTEEELKAMAEESQRAIEITEFVPAVRGRPRLLRRRLLPRPRQGRRQGLPPPQRGDEADRAARRSRSGRRAASSTSC